MGVLPVVNENDTLAVAVGILATWDDRDLILI